MLDPDVAQRLYNDLKPAEHSLLPFPTEEDGQPETVDDAGFAETIYFGQQGSEKSHRTERIDTQQTILFAIKLGRRLAHLDISDKTLESRLGFRIENRANVPTLVDDNGGERPASSHEIALWNELSHANRTVNDGSLVSRIKSAIPSVHILISDGNYQHAAETLAAALEPLSINIQDVALAELVEQLRARQDDTCDEAADAITALISRADDR